jgi:glycosyltransferase involved in cell wall biosynthesis
VGLAILAADPALYEQTYEDPALLGEYAREMRIYRTNAFLGGYLRKQRNLGVALGGQALPFWTLNRWKKFAKQLLLPDEYVLWVAKSLAPAIHAARIERADLVLATAPPFSALFLASLVAWRTRKPLVLDYRDLWTPNRFYSAGPTARNLERRIVQQASHIVVTNEPARRVMMNVFHLPIQKISVIPNGFDGQMLEEIRRGARPSSEPFRINYIGSLTARRTPEYFFAAIQQLREALPDLKLSVGIVGFAAPVHKQLAVRMNLADIVHFSPSVPQRRALEIMCNESDLLVLLQRNSEGGDFAIPGKLYEYLGSGIPFIAMDESAGATATFLQQIHAPAAVEYEDVSGIYKRLLGIVKNYARAQSDFSALRRSVSVYDRRQQAARLADILTDEVHKK